MAKVQLALHKKERIKGSKNTETSRDVGMVSSVFDARECQPGLLSMEW